MQIDPALLPASTRGALRAAAGPQARQTLPGPGNPNALVNRPARSPGAIPVAEAPAVGGNAATDLGQEVTRQKLASVDFQILRRTFQESIDQEPPAAAGSPETPPAGAGEAASSPGAGAAAAAATQEGRLTVSEVSRERLTLRVEAEVETEPRRSDPVALDLDGDGLETTGLQNGVAFDIDADGRTDRVSFVTGGDAFLALDRNDNGRIDDGRELFGDQRGAANGFEELRKLDSNGDQRIDRNDTGFEDLQLLQMDAAGNQALRSLTAAGISSIDLDYQNTRQALNAYDQVTQLSRFEREDGTQGTAGDLLLAFDTHA